MKIHARAAPLRPGVRCVSLWVKWPIPRPCQMLAGLGAQGHWALPFESSDFALVGCATWTTAATGLRAFQRNQRLARVSDAVERAGSRVDCAMFQCGLERAAPMSPEMALPVSVDAHSD